MQPDVNVPDAPEFHDPIPDVFPVTPSPKVVESEPPNEVPPLAANTNHTFVRMPDGSVVAVPNDMIQTASVTSKSEATPTAVVEVPDAEFYVHLADGSVERVKESDLPAGAGTNAMMGYWQRDKKVYHVIGVYPVEDIAKEG